MRILFIGTVEFSLQALEKIVDLGGNVIGVCTKEKSVYNSDYADLTPISQKHNIPCKNIVDINSKESINWIRELQPDVIFCFGWSTLVKRELLKLPRMGIVGFHPSILPENRGRHPIIWSLALGLKKTGATFFIMDEGADSGDILSQKEIDITLDDNASSLYQKITKSALLQIENFLPKMINDSYNLYEQDHSQANEWRKRSMPDGEIDFRMSSRTIYNLVRALTRPYVGSHIIYDGKVVSIWKVSECKCQHDNFEPGKVLDVSLKGIKVKTGDAAILIQEHEFEELPAVGEYI
ncbi:MAG: methionyl-tRNA formyltransferase [Helicobacteraceae bacterium]|nr:methionyl-tRNA formyltransferase [Helicobacteraceae bacterium]